MKNGLSFYFRGKTNKCHFNQSRMAIWEIYFHCFKFHHNLVNLSVYSLPEAVMNSTHSDMLLFLPSHSLSAAQPGTFPSSMKLNTAMWFK